MNNKYWLFLSGSNGFISMDQVRHIEKKDHLYGKNYQWSFRVLVEFTDGNYKEYWGQDAIDIWNFAENDGEADDKETQGILKKLSECDCAFDVKIAEKCETKDLEDPGELFEISIDEDNTITLTFKSRNRK